tara:strand:- start:479 stop:700 length:222 start_codon:yes stop_codon:yes gene_type:complete
MVAIIKEVGNKIINSFKTETKPEELEPKADELPEIEFSFEKTEDKALLKADYPKRMTKRTLRELKKGKTKACI